MKKFTISVCFIVKNEEKVFERILKCCQKFADEIVVVDTGSIDKTIEIAKKYTDKIYHFKWCDDFSKARNFAFSKGTCDYLMWLDADDFIFDADIGKIIKLKNQKLNFDMAFFKYVTGYDKNFKPTFEFERERLIKNGKGYVWLEPVHEVIAPSGIIVHEDIRIYHFKGEKERKNRNLEIYEKILLQGDVLSARARFYYARELYYNAKYLQAIKEFKDFLNLKDAWVENKIEACLNLSYCYLELNDRENALKILFQSFVYDLPRAEILCQLGKIYFDINYEKSIYYYKLALGCKMNLKRGGFVLVDYYSFIPNLQLCVLYFRLKNYKKSYYFHKKCKKIKPNHPSVIFNDKVFKDLGFEI